jgi:hypoxanthine-guanine phosphoribosyltransferase
MSETIPINRAAESQQSRFIASESEVIDNGKNARKTIHYFLLKNARDLTIAVLIVKVAALSSNPIHFSSQLAGVRGLSTLRGIVKT